MVLVEGSDMWAWRSVCYPNRSKLLWCYDTNTEKVIKAKSAKLEKVLLNKLEPTGASARWVLEESLLHDRVSVSPKKRKEKSSVIHDFESEIDEEVVETPRKKHKGLFLYVVALNFCYSFFLYLFCW